MTLKYRKYDSYEKYLSHQCRKLRKGLKHNKRRFIKQRFNHNVESFKKRFAEILPILNRSYVRFVLCMGARLGEEVVAFRELGFDETTGIDINPGPNNEYVVEGDFHNTTFENGSFECVYCNCIDHSWRLHSFFSECHRLLRLHGLLVLEISEKLPVKMVRKPGRYESLVWSEVTDLIQEAEEWFGKPTDSFKGSYKRWWLVFQKISGE